MQRTRHRTTAQAVTLLGLLVTLPVLVGCQGAIVGHWTLVEAKPSREVFSIDDANFRQDGTFNATVTLEGQTADQQGTYKFNGFKLILRPEAGGQREYGAVLKVNRLEVSQGSRHVVLRKKKGS